MLKKLADLHKTCFPFKPWTENDFLELKNSGCEIIASDNGFIVWRLVLDEAEIITIGVHPNQRGNGIAESMLVIAENEIKKSGGKKVFLEVAENNTPALELYKKHGYIETGKRPKYYNGIDAILMEKVL